jgi:hypothetical protein
MKNGSTPQQMAYAMRLFGGQGDSKKQIALNSGYSPSIANNPNQKIETKKGFNNAISKLAAESNCLALSIMAEFKSRGVKDFSNKDLISSLNAIAQAWSKFNSPNIEHKDSSTNKLRTIVLQRVENQTVTIDPEPDPNDF